MPSSPGKGETEHRSRKCSVNPLGINLKCRLELRVSHVKVRHAVLVVVHDDDESLKAAECRQTTTSRSTATSSSPIARAQAPILARAVRGEVRVKSVTIVSDSSELHDGVSHRGIDRVYVSDLPRGAPSRIPAAMPSHYLEPLPV